MLWTPRGILWGQSQKRTGTGAARQPGHGRNNARYVSTHSQGACSRTWCIGQFEELCRAQTERLGAKPHISLAEFTPGLCDPHHTLQQLEGSSANQDVSTPVQSTDLPHDLHEITAPLCAFISCAWNSRNRGVLSLSGHHGDVTASALTACGDRRQPRAETAQS